MFKKTILFLLFFPLFNLVYSQNSLQDSILYNTIDKKIKNYKLNKYLSKASYFFKQQNWDSTLVYTNKYLTSYNKNIITTDYAHFFRGASFNRKKLYEEAINHLKLVSPNFDFYNLTLLQLGETYLNQKKHNKAISIFESIRILPLKNYPYIKKNSILNNLALCYYSLKKYDLAEKYFKENIDIEEDTLTLIANYNNLAALYYMQYKDNIAIDYFKKGYNLSKKLKPIHNKYSKSISDQKRMIYNQKRATSKNMSAVEENRKDFKKALAYRKEAQQWKDSLNDQNKIYEVAKIEKEFAVKEKQKEVDFLQVENELKETQRNNVIYIASVLLLLLFVNIYFYREKVKRNKIIAEQKENLDALNNTKDKLFSIVSHDLRSSVNALKTSNTVLLDNLQSKNINALEGLLQKNSAIVNGAYGLLDNLLNWALLQTNQGYFHINPLRLFIIIEHVAFNYKPLLFEKELSFENSVSKKALIYADQESLKIILRNLLDNAIKFSKPNGTLKVYSEDAGDFWNLIVEDTGLGMSEKTRLELLKNSTLLNKKEHEDVLGTGLGLSLVKSMIHKNHGKFNIESELGKGTKMIVSLPKTQQNG